jgi:hypothetical protein
MEIQNVAALAPESELMLRLSDDRVGGRPDVFVPLRHSMTAREVEW